MGQCRREIGTREGKEGKGRTHRLRWRHRAEAAVRVAVLAGLERRVLRRVRVFVPHVRAGVQAARKKTRECQGTPVCVPSGAVRTFQGTSSHRLQRAVRRGHDGS